MAGDNHEERQARSLALEKAYVHDVYDQIAPHFTDTRYRPWPRVKQFLLELEPGSLVADVGCGNGKYLDINPDIWKIGADRCAALTAAARAKNFEVLTSDNLHMPFRDETFDAVLSVAVIHHFATTDRRVAAIKELTRVLRIGGKILITVWAMEQRHRKFESQDVLVPWHEPVKSSSEDRGSSVERELTSATTSDDDVLVYHAYSHISDSEQHSAAVNRKRQKYRNGRGRYRSADSAMYCRRTAGTSSQSSSELSSPNETCYSFVRRAFQRLSSSATTDSPYDTFSKKSPTRPYFYRSCRKPCVSESMEFGKYNKNSDSGSPRKEFCQQGSLDSEYPDPTTEDDIPIELRGLEGYETCNKCGTPTTEFANCELRVCASCLPADPDTGKKSRSLGDFLNMIPKLLRVKKCEKEPMSDLHKRISTASDPREYVVKTRGNDVNGIVRSKSTVSMMSRLEELMSMSPTSGKEELQTVANPNCQAGPRSKTKPSILQSFTSTVLVEGSNGTIEIRDNNELKNTRRYNSPADALQKLRQDVDLDEPFEVVTLKKYDGEKEINSCGEKKLQNSESVSIKKKSSLKSSNSSGQKKKKAEKHFDFSSEISPPEPPDNTELKPESESEGHLSSYFSMPELYKLTHDQIPEEPIIIPQKQRHISFYEKAAQNIFDDTSSESNDLSSRRRDSPLHYTARERTVTSTPQRGLVKRSLSVDTGDNSSSSHQTPRRFSASAAQGVLASALRTYSLPRSCSRGSSVKSDTSVDSEESIVSVIPRKGNSITSDTSVDSEESVISVIQRSTSEIDTLGSQNGLRNNISRFGSRSAQASPVTVLSSQTSSAESSPPQSGKNDGRFPGSVGVIDQLLQQQQQLLYSSSDTHSRSEASDHSVRARRYLLRPISDPKIEEKLSNPEELSNSFANRLNNSIHMPKTNQGSSVLSEASKPQIKEKTTDTKSNATPAVPVKPLVSDTSSEWKEEKKEQADGELSKTPSPVGPFQYITDPLITGVEPPQEVGIDADQILPSTSETESKSKSIRFMAEVTNLGQNGKTIPEMRKTPNGFIESVLKNAITKKGIIDVAPCDTDQIVATAVVNTSVDLQNSSSKISEESRESLSTKEECPSVNASTSKISDDQKLSKNKDNDMRKSFFKLRERLESLASSQNAMPNFEIFKNVSHSFGSLRNIKEKVESETTPNESPRESKISPTPKSLNDSRQSSLDESSQVTLSDESVMSVEGTSSVSDENDYKKTDDEEENPDSSQNLTVRRVDREKVIANSQTAPLNALTEVGQSSQKHCQCKKCESCTEKCSSGLHKPSKSASFSDTELHLKKGVVRCPLRKRLRRSCVTIDEVECREFMSSEDTSPSSSVSLEWNDFDKIDADPHVCTACCSGCGITTIIEGEPRDEPAIEICCDDVNVQETENKFNIVDKEMCVFFETSSSSLGKSASSSSNATDFSTTSDRFRGVMQREKSDDRSSKESDSDNLSKLSDVEGRSDSAFSEDMAKKTDPISSSSSSLDVLDSVRTKVINESECDGTLGTSKQNSSWVLDNIDEIPDDDQSHDGNEKANSADKSSNSWKPEKSMDFAQRRENFFSSAADCRDMYRITFDDKRKKKKENEDCNNSSNSEFKDPIEVGMAIPEIAPGLMEFFPPRKNQEDDEQTTGILAELVGTLSGISSLAFGDIYPKQEPKIEDFSSDESVGISTFEKVLTSGATTYSKSRPKKSSGHQKEKGSEEISEKRCNNKKLQSNGIDFGTSYSDTDNTKMEIKDMGQAFVKLPPENSPRLNSESKNSNIQNSEVKTEKITNGSNPAQPVQNEKKIPEKLKILNRTSQSVCLDRVRQSSFEKDDEQFTQSAPCSPRMKPRQRSVEEVLTSSRNELSRNSSLSQSTSQESLPGNETGGLMSYHRYYHVFRQGELDNLIETHVDNLHIISSYYDHANWCVVAEKVQVWTI
ncbi:putative tRNA methyltransferase 9B like protein [Argiope bruennichi]|uniref:Putative tRNA methyltransferase 9B like protein n=1 Tax=Argiope bruennichi TaxID=94029 RepID=A0A8T0FXJ4_ARGBR|nr:putative tRNA methyltransferase 9B like protein [Argiope bruennichi]